MPDYAQDRWLWSHLMLLAAQGDDHEAAAILDRMTQDELVYLLLCGLNASGALIRDIDKTAGGSMTACLTIDRTVYAQEVLSSLWRRSAPRE